MCKCVSNICVDRPSKLEADLKYIKTSLSPNVLRHKQSDITEIAIDLKSQLTNRGHGAN